MDCYNYANYDTNSYIGRAKRIIEIYIAVAIQIQKPNSRRWAIYLSGKKANVL